MPPTMLLFGSVLPWLAGLRLTLSFWEGFIAASSQVSAIPAGQGINSTVVMLPTRPQRRMALGTAGGQLLQFASLHANSIRRYPAR